MKSTIHPRRALLAAAAALLLAAMPAAAQDYPTKPIRLINPFAPGASTDRLARIVADSLSKSLGKQVIVESRAGAGGNLAAEATAKSPADGHTFMLVTAAILTMNPHIYKRLPFDPQKDLAPLTIAVRMPLVMIANPNVPYKS